VTKKALKKELKRIRKELKDPQMVAHHLAELLDRAPGEPTLIGDQQ
jgi:hypothetical protein